MIATIAYKSLGFARNSSLEQTSTVATLSLSGCICAPQSFSLKSANLLRTWSTIEQTFVFSLPIKKRISEPLIHRFHQSHPQIMKSTVINLLILSTSLTLTLGFPQPDLQSAPTLAAPDSVTQLTTPNNPSIADPQPQHHQQPLLSSPPNGNPPSSLSTPLSPEPAKCKRIFEECDSDDECCTHNCDSDLFGFCMPRKEDKKESGKEKA